MTKLALVLGGHASLGAYSAGAATEILTAAAENREGPAPVAVVTGSGLGAVSAALAARSLAVNRHLVPWIGSLWIDALDARHLLPERPSPGPRVLDGRPLEELTAHMVAGPPADDDRPSSALGRPLRLGIDLPGGRVPEGAGPRRGGDAGAVFELGAESDAGDPVWQEVRRAALRSSSPVLSVAPDGSGGTGSAAASELASPDGGDGEGPRRPRPMALARRLVRSHGPEPSADEWRMVVVDPDGRAAPRPVDGPAGPLLAAVRACLADELVRDWRATRDATERLELLRALAGRLPEIHGRLDDPDAVGLGRRIGELAERVAERDERRFDAPDGDRTADPALRRLDDSLRRIQAESAYAPVFRDVGSRAGRTRLAKLVYVLEAVGDLQGRGPTRLHRVRPEASEALAGDGLAGYGGFAVRAWRRHDFVAGRRDARRVLEGPLSDVIAYDPDGPEAYDPPSAPRLSAALDRDDRRSLRTRLGAAAAGMLDAVAPGGLRGVFYRLARPGLRRSLAGRLMESLEAPAVR